MIMRSKCAGVKSLRPSSARAESIALASSDRLRKQCARFCRPCSSRDCRAHIRQIILEGVLRLLHERYAVGEEKDVRNVPAAAKHVHKARSGARLSRPRRHDEQMPPRAALHLCAYGADGLLLIIAVRDFIVYPDGRKRTATAPAVYQLLQILAAENAAHRASAVRSRRPRKKFRTRSS